MATVQFVNWQATDWMAGVQFLTEMLGFFCLLLYPEQPVPTGRSSFGLELPFKL